MTNLKDYIKQKSDWYLNKYGKLDWHWFDEGVIWAIQDYLSMKGEFSQEDIEVIKARGFSSEDFINDLND